MKTEELHEQIYRQTGCEYADIINNHHTDLVMIETIKFLVSELTTIKAENERLMQSRFADGIGESIAFKTSLIDGSGGK